MPIIPGTASLKNSTEGFSLRSFSLGVDAINVSAGGYSAPNESTEPISYPQGWKLQPRKYRTPEFAPMNSDANRSGFLSWG